MNSARLVTSIFILLCLNMAAQADVFNMEPSLVNLEVVTIGDPGNAADTSVMNDYTTGYGSITYAYNIGQYEVTAAQ